MSISRSAQHADQKRDRPSTKQTSETFVEKKWKLRKQAFTRNGIALNCPGGRDAGKGQRQRAVSANSSVGLKTVTSWYRWAWGKNKEGTEHRRQNQEQWTRARPKQRPFFWLKVLTGSFVEDTGTPFFSWLLVPSVSILLLKPLVLGAKRTVLDGQDPAVREKPDKRRFLPYFYIIFDLKYVNVPKLMLINYKELILNYF